MVDLRSLGLALLALAPSVAAGAAGYGEHGATPVLLSFDVEHDGDLEPLAEVRRLGVPVTFFFTGEFAEGHPELVAELARGNTIGSHAYSHADLTTLPPAAVRRELELGKTLIERAAGRPPRWFRAPYGAYDEEIMTVAAELGFRYDSSDWSRWQLQPLLLELPVSNGDGGLLASDWSLVSEERMSHDEMLDWLKASYRERRRTGRPFVVLLHPFVLAPRIAALADFVAFVEGDGGVFLTFDEYLRRATAPRPRRTAMWVDWSRESRHDPGRIAADAVRAGVTDVFLMARDTRGRRYARPRRRGVRDLFGTTAARLEEARIRVHAWIPALRDRAAARRRPRRAMLADDGRRSPEWLSPTAPKVRRCLVATVTELLESYDVDGIHLSDLRYPDLGHDFAPRAVSAFAHSAGIELGDEPASELRRRHSGRWTEWRARQLAEVAREVSAAVRRHGGRGVTLSASLSAEAAISHQAWDLSGEDYALLARHLDFIVPKLHHAGDGESAGRIARVLFSARHQAGRTPVWIGIEATRRPGTGEPPAALSAAAAGSDGVVYTYPLGEP